MEKNDFRTVSESARFLIRKRSILLLQSGRKQYEVAEIIGVKKETICGWNISYKKGGFEALKGKKTGVKSEDKKLLNTQQEKEIQSMIIDKMPEQLKLDFALWTRKAVKELVEREFKVVLAISSLTFANTNYILTKLKSAKEARDILRKVLIEILTLDDKITELALIDDDFPYFED